MKKIVKLVVIFVISTFMFMDVNADELDPFSVNGVGYSNFANALTAVPDGGEIVLETDFVTTETLKINTDKTVSINMNGHSITSSNVYGVITVYKGIINIDDSVGTSIIRSTAFESAYAKTIYVYKRYSSFNSVLTLNNVTIESNYYGVYLGTNGIVTMNNVSNSSVYNFVIGNNSKLYINGGVYFASAYNLFGLDANSVDSSEIEINSGCFASQLGNITLSNELSDKVGKFISGGTFDHDISEYVQDGYTVIIDNGNCVVIDPNTIVDNSTDTSTDNSLDNVDLDALINEYEDRLNGLDDRENAFNDSEEYLNYLEIELDYREDSLDNHDNSLSDREN
ncbi:MAG: hypothetical protein Q4E69_04265, partial [Bacilli bacterium]|nr:hypothetical protein [Bacilli bacterium]